MSLHLAEPLLLVGRVLLEPTLHLLVLQLITPPLCPPPAENTGVKLDLFTKKSL